MATIFFMVCTCKGVTDMEQQDTHVHRAYTRTISEYCESYCKTWLVSLRQN